jgi:hypothetical protein
MFSSNCEKRRAAHTDFRLTNTELREVPAGFLFPPLFGTSFSPGSVFRAAHWRLHVMPVADHPQLGSCSDCAAPSESFYQLDPLPRAALSRLLCRRV